MLRSMAAGLSGWIRSQLPALSLFNPAAESWLPSEPAKAPASKRKQPVENLYCCVSTVHGGHGNIGGAKTQTEVLAADEWSFLLWQFGVPAYQSVKSVLGE